MIQAIALDSTPLGLIVQRPGYPEADECRNWLARHAAAGTKVLVADIIDYEVRRELLRLGKSSAISLLDHLYANSYVRRLVIDGGSLRLASELWAQVRRRGRPTADRFALDIDVILAAQVLTSGIPASDLCVATSNVKHFASLVPAQEWSLLMPPP